MTYLIFSLHFLLTKIWSPHSNGPEEQKPAQLKKAKLARSPKPAARLHFSNLNRSVNTRHLSPTAASNTYIFIYSIFIFLYIEIVSVPFPRPRLCQTTTIGDTKPLTNHTKRRRHGGFDGVAGGRPDWVHHDGAPPPSQVFLQAWQAPHSHR